MCADTCLFGVRDKLFELIMQRLQKAFALFVLATKARQHD